MRWYACSFCPKEFKKPSDLIRHLRVHTQEKPFKVQVNFLSIRSHSLLRWLGDDEKRHFFFFFPVHVLRSFFRAQINDDSARTDSHRSEEVRLRLLRQNVRMQQQSHRSREVSFNISTYIRTLLLCFSCILFIFNYYFVVRAYITCYIYYFIIFFL